MAKPIKKKTSFGRARVDHFSPAPKAGWPNAINVNISFEEALKLHLGLGQLLQHLNTYSRATKAGRDSAVKLCLFIHEPQITISEGRIK